jgi:hypothetical protein
MMSALFRFLVLATLVVGAVMIVARLIHQFEAGAHSRRRKWASGRGGVRFDPSGGDAAPDLSGQSDAFTGEPLDRGRGLYRCEDCQAVYHADTVALLAREHGGRCAGCRGTSIRPFAGPGR